MRILTVFLTFLSCLVGHGGEPDSPVTNLVSNPGFELGKPDGQAPGWKLETPPQYVSQIRCAVSDKSAASGKQSMVLFNLVRDPRSEKEKFSSSSLVSEEIPIDKTKQYEVSAKILVPNALDGGRARLCVDVMDGNHEPRGSALADFDLKLENGWLVANRTIDDWSVFTKSLKFNWSKVRINVFVSLQKSQADSAIIYVDDVSFGPNGKPSIGRIEESPLPIPTINLLQNPGFELGRPGGLAPGWRLEIDPQYISQVKCVLTDKFAASGRQSMTLFNLMRDPRSEKKDFSSADLVSDEILIDKTKQYAVSAKILVPNALEGAKARLTVEIMDEAHKPQGCSIADFEVKQENGWIVASRTVDDWSGFTRSVKFKWSKVRVNVAVFIHKSQNKESMIFVDDVSFGPTGNPVKSAEKWP